ncbi:hypothetical protein J8TS2_05960 [Lederbergia ruris]|uniref:Uncharacterized protein n=1 Tax=Lederbergia ruris TaxID=217495 RepID=A0ABQ4KE78_9BACI|nr:hypothetical protein J8TS2_05960 [Lederbergia ruris]
MEYTLSKCLAIIARLFALVTKHLKNQKRVPRTSKKCLDVRKAKEQQKSSSKERLDVRKSKGTAKM